MERSGILLLPDDSVWNRKAAEAAEKEGKMAKKVLVVDDEKLIVKGIRFSLEQDGMEVECAYDGEEALQKIKDTEYDIVLLDVMLPRLTGFEVCQQVREFSAVPIVMLTAKGEDMDKILGLEYGARRSRKESWRSSTAPSCTSYPRCWPRWRRNTDWL